MSSFEEKVKKYLDNPKIKEAWERLERLEHDSIDLGEQARRKREQAHNLAEWIKVEILEIELTE